MKNKDVIVIGAGPGGIAAAISAKKNGAESVLVLERDTKTGGILNQCIHDGFGLTHYHRTLTGPEYAAYDYKEALEAGIEIMTGAMVTGMTGDKEITAVTRNGLETFKAGAVVIATGCRERTRGAIAIPGSRPAGVLTAGTAQRLINVDRIMVGRKIVILGSGDVGLIMARRLTFEGAKVECVLEIQPSPCGLERNVSQCLYDFGIPLYVNTTVSRIYGKERLTGIDAAQVDENGRIIPGSEKHIDCDTLILSVGLIPENEIAKMAGVELNQRSNGILTDDYLQSSVPGIFACGNARSVMDLADFVSEQGSAAGRNAALFIRGEALMPMPDEKHNKMKKGFPEEGSVTCVLCPNGCALHYDKDGNVTGNKCPRGVTYAKQEMIAPKRNLTSIMRLPSGKYIPVKTSAPIPKEKLLEAAMKLREIRLEKEEYELNEVVVKDFLGLGADVIITSNGL